MTEQKYTLEEAKIIIAKEYKNETQRIRNCIAALTPIFPQGQLPFINSSTMLFHICENRQKIVEILQQVEATPSGE